MRAPTLDLNFCCMTDSEAPTSCRMRAPTLDLNLTDSDAPTSCPSQMSLVSQAIKSGSNTRRLTSRIPISNSLLELVPSPVTQSLNLLRVYWEVTPETVVQTLSPWTRSISSHSVHLNHGRSVSGQSVHLNHLRVRCKRQQSSRKVATFSLR